MSLDANCVAEDQWISHRLWPRLPGRKASQSGDIVIVKIGESALVCPVLLLAASQHGNPARPRVSYANGAASVVLVLTF
jgi:hypothetical protein